MRDAVAPMDRLKEVRRRSLGLRDCLLAEPEVLFWRSFNLVRAPYPTCYAFAGVNADRGFKALRVHLFNRAFVVQYRDHEGALSTLLMSPTDPDANREAPFFRRLADQAPGWVPPVLAPQYYTVASALAESGRAVGQCGVSELRHVQRAHAGLAVPGAMQ